MATTIVGWVLVAFLFAGLTFIVLFKEIRAKWREFRANRIVKREVPPPDRFDDELRKHLERHRNGR